MLDMVSGVSFSFVTVDFDCLVVIVFIDILAVSEGGYALSKRECNLG